ncbi:MAG: CinA family nicotinamide mononucleotide deamidase-related protein [Bacteroidales bacterium]|nr:CinA family nicotinamide mononucleotide deamidase-related protein [Bacteroidales bacterium]
MKELVIKNISIGDELLIGQVINTNAAWLGEHLSEAGFQLDSVLTIGDSERAILDAFDACMDAELVLVTGGLGPTADDITKPTVCKFFDTELEFCQAAYDNVLSLFKRRGFQMSERNRSQAMLPKSCVYIPNTYGTAPCMWLEKKGVVFVFMPGVPFEMKGIFTDELLPRIKARFHSVPYEKRVIMTTGIGESFLADRIKEWEEALPGFLSLAYLPQYGMVRLRLSGSHEDADLLHVTLDDQVKKLTQLIPEYIFSMQDQPIERTVFDLLINNEMTFASAESCTGGNIAHVITLIPGSSDVFKGTAVTYATPMKTKVLGVPAELIEKHGVVSQKVVESMAESVRNLMEADFGVATTGVAGPSGGTEENPIGTVWIGLASPSGVVSKRFNFGKDRENVINRATIAAYEMLRECILTYAPRGQ